MGLLRQQCLRCHQLPRNHLSPSMSSLFQYRISPVIPANRVPDRQIPFRQVYPSYFLSSRPWQSRITSRWFSTPTQREKHENIYTIPNILTFTRLLSTPAIAYLILNDKPYLATGLLLYAGLTDLIDGYIARKYDLKSVVGTILDPMADKFLMITLTGALAYTGAMPGTCASYRD